MGILDNEPSGTQPGEQALKGNHLLAPVRDGSARKTGTTGPSNHSPSRELRSHHGSERPNRHPDAPAFMRESLHATTPYRWIWCADGQEQLRHVSVGSDATGGQASLIGQVANELQ